VALTIDEQQELLGLMRQLASVKQKSRSPLRPPGQQEVDTLAGLVQFTDAHVHELLIERLAVGYGDPQSILLLQEIANADLTAHPDRCEDALLAKRILGKVDTAYLPPAHEGLRKVPGPLPGDPPYLNGAKPTMIPGANVIPLQDDPPGFPVCAGPGPERDGNWLEYFNGRKGDGTARIFLRLPKALPNPEAVQATGLRVIGAAARQQGVSYAWGGNKSTLGPTPGTLDGDPPGGGAHQFGDDGRIGFDCGGLVRFAVAQTIRKDPFECNGQGGPGTDCLDSSTNLTRIKGALVGAAAIDKYADPGDILVFSYSDQPFSRQTHHTGIYLGNGAIINAPQSGCPVRADPLSNWQSEHTDVLRAQ